jgi:hypothetical protein
VLSDRNLAKLKAYQSDGWEVALVGNGLDCRSYQIHASECKQGQFFGSDEKEIYSVTVAPNNDVYLVFADGSSQVREHDDYQEVWVKDNSLRTEVAKMSALLWKLDIGLGLLCPDNGFSVYFVRPYTDFHQIYRRDQCTFERQGLNFRLPNDGMLEMAKQAFHYREFKTVYIKLWWLYREWQEKTDDQFVFIGDEVV